MKHTLLSLMVMAIFSIAAFSVIAQNPSKPVPAAQYYTGGQEAMYKFLDEKKVYPAMAKRNRIQGECIIHIEIEADGRISAATVVSNKGGGTGEEALRVLKLLKFNGPGYKVATNIPVIFKL
jgi:periplasmic protein TonB